mmetsp:Transcript_100248/g.283900  ORF Transcript_100248/g.283900 Transcript_100248/m.283900 type:complete len:115 (+) Transcript_100248:60-404(+)
MAAVLRSEGGSLAEHVLIELQCILAMDDGSSLPGQELGTLELAADGKEVTMKNGPRTLYGQLKDLPKPLVVMKKSGRSTPYPHDPKREIVHLEAAGVIRRKAIFTDRPQLSIHL